MATIFCVEDDAGIREIEIYTLKSTGFTARGFADGAAFFETLAKEKPSLVILDVMLPGEDGVEILKRLKAAPATCDIPVIMATAKGMEYDRVQSLDLGADDYLTKPFGMMEMVSRVRAVLRRCHADDKPQILRQGGLSVDPTARTVTADSAPVTLTYKEFELLAYFMENAGIALSREKILNSVWNYDYFGDARTIDTHVKKLRAKMGDKGKYITTVWGMGYKMEGGITLKNG